MEPPGQFSAVTNTEALLAFDKLLDRSPRTKSVSRATSAQLRPSAGSRITRVCRAGVASWPARQPA